VQDDLDLALRLADRADAITMKRFRSGELSVEVKPDASPVTEVDPAGGAGTTSRHRA
jgi:histidinol-phosphatase